MAVGAGDRVEMKKPHPCGCSVFTVLRIGMDFRMKCDKCGHEVTLPRKKAEKNIRKILE